MGKRWRLSPVVLFGILVLVSLVIIILSHTLVTRVNPQPLIVGKRQPNLAIQPESVGNMRDARQILDLKGSKFTIPAISNATTKLPVVAHVVSLIFCPSSSKTAGFLDALLILKNSLLQVHAPRHLESQYQVQMYAIINEENSCRDYAPQIKRLGYIPIVRKPPVNISADIDIDIDDPVLAQNRKYYKTHVGGENCCGAHEFLKLYAYTLTEHPVVVHWDVDVLILKPLDVLYDVLLYDVGTDRGIAARKKLKTVRNQNTIMSSNFTAAFTRDVTSSTPWNPILAMQGGLLAILPDNSVFDEYLSIIKHGNYTPGKLGWSGLGYGGFQGAMAIQGVVAYYYDIKAPFQALELDVCRWNNVVADVVWRGPQLYKEHHGECRQYPLPGVSHQDNTPQKGYCEDCRRMGPEMGEVYSVHYTACKKPWECTLPYPRVPGKKRQNHSYRLRELTNMTTCGHYFREYFIQRQEVENRLGARGVQPVAREGGRRYELNSFLGYCKKRSGYQPISSIPENIDLTDLFD